ncbi:adenosylcobinamide-GDP ribazoletransferase [Alkalimarinus coralli]|uniref:adenosylcobinamide-GDP ribazoletransferase n=1 Tax=Alkalimarinus coralli TaxID=2935863 RepID=UPI00202AF259|nr:adenosylcobinamide-GDP ribazoletransferase [Alkalimarinus coralli]
MKNINWRRELDLFFTAVMFLTRLPTPKWVQFEEQYLTDCSRYFPLVGLLVGLVAAASYAIFSLLLGSLLAVILSMSLTVLITGAFHEDGFADSCDGFGGGWEKDQILRIMKDSRLGSYGALGLLLILGTKLMALLTLAAQEPLFNVFTSGQYSGNVVCALVVAHPLSRLFCLLIIYNMDYVQESQKSKVASQAQKLTDNALWFAAASVAWLLLLLDVVTVLVLLGTLWVVYVGIKRYLLAKIGGYTGDCLGAAQQLAEVIIYILLCTSFSALGLF